MQNRKLSDCKSLYFLPAERRSAGTIANVVLATRKSNSLVVICLWIRSNKAIVFFRYAQGTSPLLHNSLTPKIKKL